ncbi:DUF4150 domain-containing protein [uncultured Desulfobacter sp.]|uniref:DUF4150 domain-containing protein n=1 Tax=uncultured Desulfobacter sp. TaxID=240139 RepID=UPI002AAA70B0|nr:DUF4150 domain-containing protein [uncultured Desulfobacter sp.]
MTAIFNALTKAGGQCLGFPDVCRVPAPPAPDIPTPFPNTGDSAQARKTSQKVLFAGKPVLTEKSEIPKSQGDEAGVNGGVVSGTNMDKIMFKKGSSKVIIEGHGCIHLTSPTSHNGSNANMPSGLVVSCSQAKVIVGL